MDESELEKTRKRTESTMTIMMSKEFILRTLKEALEALKNGDIPLAELDIIEAMNLISKMDDEEVKFWC